jgi:hypothetical protein
LSAIAGLGVVRKAAGIGVVLDAADAARLAFVRRRCPDGVQPEGIIGKSVPGSLSDPHADAAPATVGE